MCIREAASVEAVSERLEGQIRVVGVATTGSGDDYLEFVDDHGLTFPSFDDTFGVIFDAFGIPSTPTIVMVATDGTSEGLFGAADDAIIDMLVRNATS